MLHPATGHSFFICKMGLMLHTPKISLRKKIEMVCDVSAMGRCWLLVPFASLFPKKGYGVQERFPGKGPPRLLLVAE